MGAVPPFPIIVGRGRSGTTLLQAILTTHPDLAIPPESHLLVTLGRRCPRYERPEGFAMERFAVDFGRHWGFRRWGMPEAEVRAALEASLPGTCADAVRAVYARYAALRGKTRYGDKTPIYVLHIPFLARLFPEARFVHLIRDGRDVALSYLDARFGPRTVGAAAVSWKRFVNQGRRAGRALGPARYLELRYEDLLADLEGQVRRVCGFIGIGYEPSMLRYFEDVNAVVAGTRYETEHRNLRLPPTKGLRDWRRQMSRQDVALFEAIAGDLLFQLGYERAVPRPPLSARVRARAEVAAVLRARLGRAWRKRVRRGTPSAGEGGGAVAVMREEHGDHSPPAAET
jgi:hypothetical protein